MSAKEASKAHSSSGLDGDVFVYHTVGSTNEHAKELLALGEPEGTVVLARAQSVGRGRMKRGWHSPPGGLYMSIILGPFGPGFAATLVPLMAGVALAKALADSHALSPALKWPNDVLLGGKKVSGILSDAARFPDGSPGAVLGIGVNCDQESFPGGLSDSATSVRKETGAAPRTMELFQRLLVYLNAGKELLHLGEGRVVVEEWRSLSATLGQTVAVELARERRLEGRAVDIDDEGCLLVDAEGETVRVVAGDVVHLRTG